MDPPVKMQLVELSSLLSWLVMQWMVMGLRSGVSKTNGDVSLDDDSLVKEKVELGHIWNVMVSPSSRKWEST